MQIRPYTVTFGDRVSHYCKALFDDGSQADMFSPSELSELEWEIKAVEEAERVAAVAVAVEPAVEVPTLTVQEAFDAALKAAGDTDGYSLMNQFAEACEQKGLLDDTEVYAIAENMDMLLTFKTDRLKDAGDLGGVKIG